MQAERSVQRCEELVLHFRSPVLVPTGTSEIAHTHGLRDVTVINNPPPI